VQDGLLIAAFFTVIVLVFFTLPRLFLWMQRQERERERLEQTEIITEAVLARLAPVAAQMTHQVADALAELRAAHQEEMRRAIAAACGELDAKTFRQVDAALAEHRAALRQELVAIEAAISETLADVRDEACNLTEACMRERVFRPRIEQRPADHPEGLVVVNPRSRRAADTADAPALPAASSCSSGASRVHRHTLEPSLNKHPVAPAEATAQRTIRHDHPRRAVQAGPPAAPGPSAVSSHQHVRMDPTPTPVSRISRDRGGGAARAKRSGAQLSGSRAPSGAHAQASLSASAAVLPVAAAAEALHPRRQRAEEPQRYPPLSALLHGIENKRRAAPTQGGRDLSSGSLFYADVVRRHVREQARARV